VPTEEDILFGDLAVEKGHVTRDQADECLQNQKAMAEMGVKQRLGDIMVSKRYIDRAAQREILREQQKRTGRHIVIGSYEVVSKVGQGGMGAVYKAKVQSTGMVVALKVLPKRLASNTTFVARFHREAEIASELNHPNIVRAIQSGEHGGYHYFAMEFVDGETVGERLTREGSIPEGEALRVARDVALALQHASDAGMVHRDIKPDNVFLGRGGDIKLGDMGLARETDQDITSITQSGMMVGTPHYVSPEQAQGERNVDIRSDIYSLGATLYHMVTGQVPFEGPTALVVLSKHLNEELPWPAELNDDLTDDICYVIQRMMAKEREDRYQEPLELIHDIDVVLRGESPESEVLPVGKSSIRKALRVRDDDDVAERRRRRREVDARRSTRRAISVAGLAAARRQRQTNWAFVGSGIGAGVVMVIIALVLMLSPPKQQAFRDPSPRQRVPARTAEGRPPRRTPGVKRPTPRPAEPVRRPPVRPAPAPPRPSPPAREPVAPAPPAPPAVTPAAPRPAPGPAGPAASLTIDHGNAKIIWQESFDGAEAAGWSGGPERTVTLEGSAGARAATFKPANEYQSWSVGFSFYRMVPSKRAFSDAVFLAEDDVYISFYYYLSGDGKIAVYGNNSRLRKNLHNNVDPAVQNRWTPMVLKVMDFEWSWDKTATTRVGDKYSELSFAAGKPGEKGARLVIDDFTISKGPRPVIRSGRAPAGLVKSSRYRETFDAGGGGWIGEPVHDAATGARALRFEAIPGNKYFAYHAVCERHQKKIEGCSLRTRFRFNYRTTGGLSLVRMQCFLEDAAGVKRNWGTALPPSPCGQWISADFPAERLQMHAGPASDISRGFKLLDAKFYAGRPGEAGKCLIDDFEIYDTAPARPEPRVVTTPAQPAQPARETPEARFRATMDEFDARAMVVEYRDARQLLSAARREKWSAQFKEELGAAARVLAKLEADEKMSKSGLTEAVGKEIQIHVGGNLRTCKITAVHDDALEVEREVRMGPRRVKASFRVKLDQIDPASLENLRERHKPKTPDGYVAAALLAMARKDRRAAARYLRAAGDHPLVPHYRTRLEPGGSSSAPGAPATPVASGRPRPAAAPSSFRLGGINFGNARVSRLRDGRIEVLWEFDRPIDPDAWYLQNVLPDDAGKGHVRMLHPGVCGRTSCAYHRTMVPRLVFDGDVEVEAVFSGLGGMNSKGEKAFPSPRITICSARPAAGGKIKATQIGSHWDYTSHFWGPLDVTGKHLPPVASDHILKVATRGQVADLSWSADSKGPHKTAGRLPAFPGRKGLELTIHHCWLYRDQGRLERLRVVGQPVARLDLADPVLSVPKKASAMEQWTYAAAIKNWNSVEAHAAYRAQVLHFPKDMAHIGGEGALYRLTIRGGPAAALELWEKVKDDISQNEAVKGKCHLLVGQAWQYLGRRDEALEHLMLGREEISSYARAVGEAYYVFGEHDRAIREWERCAAKWNDDPAVYAQLGIAAAYRQKGQLDRSLAAYRKMLQRWPTSWLAPRAHFAMAAVHREKGELTQALAVSRQIIARWPADKGSCDKARKMIAEIEALLGPRNR